MSIIASKKTAWLIISNQENWDLASEKGVFGINNTPGKLRGIKKGDPYVLFISKVGFIGWGEITMPYFISNTEIWKDKLYRHRFGVSPLRAFDKVLPGAAIKDDLDFITEKNKWPVHLRGGLRKISIADFNKIRAALAESKTSYASIEKTPKEIGDQLHDRIIRLFENSGFSILESNKSKEGPDIILEDPLTKENTRIIIQCKKTEAKTGGTYPSLQKDIDEYAHKIKKNNAVVAIIALSGFKVSRDIDPVEALENDRVAIWTDEIIEYYEDLAKKISGFSKYQILGDLGIHAQFQDDITLDAIEINQGKYKYYTVAVSPEWLLKATTVLRRINYSGKIAGYQRLLNKKRITKDIPKYLESDKWIFPNAIICTSKQGVGTSMRFSHGKITLSSRYGIWWVIDGQHRLYSFTHSPLRTDKNAQLILTLIDSASFGDNAEAEQASIFVSLNQEAKKVQKKLLVELEDVLGIRNPNVQIVFGLAAKPVFKNSISGYSQKAGTISLVAFTEDQSLKQILSKYRARFASDKDKIIKNGINDLGEYFSQVAKIFKEEWSRGEYILKTDRGIKGLLALYVKILEKNTNGHSEKAINTALSALKKSNMELRSEYLTGKYLGAGGGKQFADDMAIYISKIIEGFEPRVSEVVLDTRLSHSGDSSAIDVIKKWLSEKMEGMVRIQQMHIDRSTFDILQSLDLRKVKSIKIFFSDIPTDEKNAVRGELEKMRKAGYDIIITRATKPFSEGGLLHNRWIGNDKYCVYTDSDLKDKALKNGGVTLKLTEWKQSPQLKEFDDLWDFAARGMRGVKFEYDWNGED